MSAYDAVPAKRFALRSLILMKILKKLWSLNLREVLKISLKRR